MSSQGITKEYGIAIFESEDSKSALALIQACWKRVRGEVWWMLDQESSVEQWGAIPCYLLMTRHVYHQLSKTIQADNQGEEISVRYVPMSAGTFHELLVSGKFKDGYYLEQLILTFQQDGRIVTREDSIEQSELEQVPDKKVELSIYYSILARAVGDIIVGCHRTKVVRDLGAPSDWEVDMDATRFGDSTCWVYPPFLIFFEGSHVIGWRIDFSLSQTGNIRVSDLNEFQAISHDKLEQIVAGKICLESSPQFFQTLHQEASFDFALVSEKDPLLWFDFRDDQLARISYPWNGEIFFPEFVNI